MLIKSIYSDQSRKEGLQLIIASEKGNVETVESLLKKDVYIHAQDREGRCALVAAAYKNYLEIVDLLNTPCEVVQPVFPDSKVMDAGNFVIRCFYPVIHKVLVVSSGKSDQPVLGSAAAK